MATTHIRGAKPYAVGGDFALWLRRFEAYARSVKIPVGQMCDSLLALLDDAAFRAFDLLGLSDEEKTDYKKLIAALSRRFASVAGEAELRFQLGQRCQQTSETLDDFVDALIDLTNRAYPEMDPPLRMSLARDRFIAGVRGDNIQERLFQEAPKILDEARDTAKRLEAARAARKRMQGDKATVYAVDAASGNTSCNGMTRWTSGSCSTEHRHIATTDAAVGSYAAQVNASAITRQDQTLEAAAPELLEVWRIGPLHAQLSVGKRAATGATGQSPAASQLKTHNLDKEKVRRTIFSAAAQGAVYATGRVNEVKTPVLIDTGSAVTIIHRKLWERGKKKGSPELRKLSEAVVVANGEPLQIIGAAEVVIQVADTNFITKPWLPTRFSRSVYLEQISLSLMGLSSTSRQGYYTMELVPLHSHRQKRHRLEECAEYPWPTRQ